MDKITPRNLQGIMELLPNDQIVFNGMKDIIRKNFESFGFLPLDQPVLENSAVLLAKAGGDTEKQIYRFNKGDNDICMRFDLTVPLAKYVAMNYENLTFPFRRYQINKVYRGERPQHGRFREFYQCDIDIIGKDFLSLIYDAEIPSIMYNVFKELNIGKFIIFISNRKLLLGLVESLNLKNISAEIFRVIDKFDKIGLENVKLTLIDDYKIATDSVKILTDFIQISGSIDEKINKLKSLKINSDIFHTGLNELQEVVKYMRAFGVPDDYFDINLTIVRGLDYYTGTIYETMLSGFEKLGSICSGGRFDNLAEFYTDKKLPGVGMSIGLTRLFDQLRENDLIKTVKKSISDVVVLPMGEYQTEAIFIANEIRESGLNAEVYFEESKMKSKILYADRNKVPYIIIIGEDEVKNNFVTLKNLSTFEQVQVDIKSAINIIKNN